MEQIPGKDNYRANLTDHTMGARTVQYSSQKDLNVGFYSRYYAASADASGRSGRKRGFSDPTLWAAKTRQPKVSGLSYADGYGPTKCSLSDDCIASMAKQTSAVMRKYKDTLTGDQVWQMVGYDVSTKSKFKCPQVSPVPADYTKSTEYHSDAHLMCRWKVSQKFYTTYKDSTAVYEGLIATPTAKDPTCGKINPGLGVSDAMKAEWKKCPREKSHEKWTWAIPLELIYLTPLHKWNPYDLEMKTEAEQTKGGRTGDATDAAKAFDGLSKRYFAQTPINFYSGDPEAKDPADTAKSSYGVLDKQGVLRNTVASGINTHFRKIEGVGGGLRQRFPIFPVHVAGNNVFKELKALEAIQLTGNQAMTAAVREEALGVKFELTFANGHVHTINVDGHTLVTKLASVGSTHTVSSSLNNGHEHQVTLKRLADSKFEMVSMNPPEPHRLIAITASAKVQDSAIKANGAVDAAPQNAAAAVGENAKTTKALAALYVTLNKLQTELSTLKSNAKNAASSCTDLSAVKNLLTNMKPGQVAKPVPEPAVEPEKVPEAKPEPEPEAEP